MTRILLGALQPGARAIGIGITGARRGTANFGGQHRGVIVKGGTADELAAECFCNLPPSQPPHPAWPQRREEWSLYVRDELVAQWDHAPRPVI